MARSDDWSCGLSDLSRAYFSQFATFTGNESLQIMQIGEQIDYLRFMPAKTKENSKAWWAAVISAGPGWVILGAIKQIIGAFLGFYLLTKIPGVNSTEPVQQFNAAFHDMLPGWAALTLAVILVVISQIKINVTNAYSGSLAWTSAYTY